MGILLYHPDLKETHEATNEREAEVLKKSGWTEEVPKKYEAEAEKKEQ